MSNGGAAGGRAQPVLADSQTVMGDLACDDLFEQNRSRDDFGTTTLGYPPKFCTVQDAGFIHDSSLDNNLVQF